MPSRGLRVLLFLALALSVPLPYVNSPAVAGLVPWDAMLLLSVLPGWRVSFGLITVIVNVVQVCGYALLLRLVAWGAARLIERVEPESRKTVVAIIVAAVVAIGFLPFYGLGHSWHAQSAVSLYVQLLTRKAF